MEFFFFLLVLRKLGSKWLNNPKKTLKCPPGSKNHFFHIKNIGSFFPSVILHDHTKFLIPTLKNYAAQREEGMLCWNQLVARMDSQYFKRWRSVLPCGIVHKLPVAVWQIPAIGIWYTSCARLAPKTALFGVFILQTLNTAAVVRYP